MDVCFGFYFYGKNRFNNSGVSLSIAGIRTISNSSNKARERNERLRLIQIDLHKHFAKNN